MLLSAQSIVITSPNGGEVWQGCTTQTITWNNSGTSDFYSIDYSINGGSTWTSIATFYNTTSGEYDWDVPNLQSTNVLIRVQDSNNIAIQDISNISFSITASLLLTYPNGGETITGGDFVTITWLATNTSSYYSLEYSLNGGASWNNIVFNEFLATPEYLWTVPALTGTNFLVRVTDNIDNCKSDVSEAEFEISAVAQISIVLDEPNGGEVYQSCTQVMVEWSDTGTSDIVDIEFSPDGGATWQTSVTNHFSLSDQYNWYVPNIATTDGLLRVYDHNNLVYFDESDFPFTIEIPAANAGPDLTVCQGGSLVLEASGGVSYSWSPSAGLSADNIANPIASPSSSTVYTLTVTYVNGCTASDDVLVEVLTNCDIEGCTDPTAWNYDPSATVDNGFCLYENGGGVTCAGDTNGDGIINTNDLLNLLSAFGSTCE